MKYMLLMICSFGIIAANAQVSQQITGKPLVFKVPKIQNDEVKEELQQAVEDKEQLIQQQLEDYVSKMLSNKQLTENVQTSVNVNVVNEVGADGKKELNLHAKYGYEIIGAQKDRVQAEIDDYPPGKYKLGSSNAAKSTMQILKQTVEGNLTDVMAAGSKVTIKITGTTDATPINNAIPYTNDFGVIEDFVYFLNGTINSISINSQTGITSNEQLGLLRTYGVRQFMETYIEPLKRTNNSFEHYVEVGKPGDLKSRRVSIELIVHDAFKNFKYDSIKTDSLKRKKTEEKSDVDINIPQTAGSSQDLTYVAIVGNEDYSSHQTDLGTEVNVDFAINDAKIFKEYCIKTLGIPEKNIFIKTNATAAEMKRQIMKLGTIAELNNGNANLIYYYSGHGLPDETTKEGYIMPVDVSGSDIKNAVKINDLYNQLTEYPCKHVTVFLDACFSGGARNKGLVSLKGVKIKAKEPDLLGNIVVFTSSSNDESSCTYKQKKHGIFTYFLLKKLQESNGLATYKQLADYISEKVSLENVVVNSKKQTPSIQGGSTVSEIWKDWKLK